ncbi:YhcB family protein [Aliikangiella coralliicola]|uniref:Z-ring associated protein G n=1 Tax=Aliikangiella coralliicola TaxID=2592383 RepID=A0A545UK10_9GAMM|nr:DUF1043 family protein [Aliikangiella coralliicola]TQV89800.1 DUF1043 family protein [Aliikangiella coralliicola]
MEVISIVLGIIAGAAGGFYFGRNFSGNANEKSRLETELKEKQSELDAFRNKVTNHFEKTAVLFNQVSDSYQSLYDHIAKSSTQLCSTATFQSLPQSTDEQIESKPNPVHKTNTDSENLFDANKLYNAHDYRNNTEELEETEKLNVDFQDDKVVDIESAKEEKSEPALDYAIKEEGVINHNSLDIDGVKTSK